MTAEQNDTLSRWAPTWIALLGMLGTVLWVANRAGAIEQRVDINARDLTTVVTRAEYLADKNATAAQLADVKITLRDINAKLDRALEAQRKP